MPARTIAIGDIHGCDAALSTLLRELAPAADDLVIVLGDVIDRGPDSLACVETLLELKTRTRMIHLMGNHEEMFLDALTGGGWKETWLQNGGREMLDSYGGMISDVPEAHVDFLRGGKDFYETSSHIFTHATINPAWPPEQQSGHYLRWNRLTGREDPHVSGRLVVCGHTAQKSGEVAAHSGWLCIDTCAYCRKGRLTALVVEENQLWQADQAGEFLGKQPVPEESAV